MSNEGQVVLQIYITPAGNVEMKLRYPHMTLNQAALVNLFLDRAKADLLDILPTFAPDPLTEAIDDITHP